MMKYFYHVSIDIIVRAGEGLYEFATWGNPYWYRETGNLFDSYSRDSYYEISREEAEEFLAAALQDEKKGLLERRPDGEVVTVCIAEKGLQPYIYNWYAREEVEDEEWYFEANLTWFEYHVLREDVDELIGLYNERLSCDWTPNQEWDEQEENRARSAEIRKLIDELETKAAETIGNSGNKLGTKR